MDLQDPEGREGPRRTNPDEKEQRILEGAASPSQPRGRSKRNGIERWARSCIVTNSGLILQILQVRIGPSRPDWSFSSLVLGLVWEAV